MNDAIDFRKLWLDEKHRARDKAGGKGTPDSSAPQSSSTPASTAASIPSTDPPETRVRLPVWNGPNLDTLVPCVPVLNHHTHRVPPPAPDSIYYLPHFLPDSWSAPLLTWLQALPSRPPLRANHATDTARQVQGQWTTLTHARRRVALFDARLEPLPPPLLAMAHALVHAGIRFDASHRSGTAPDTPPRLPNHVLINEYQPADGILPHTDGPSYEPCTATLSLGGDVVLRFAPRVHRKEDPQARLTTRPTDAHAVYLSGRGSLVVFRDDAYRDYGHAIRYTDHRYAHDNDDNNNNNHDTETVPTDCYYRADHDTASESLVSSLPASPIVRAYRVSLTFRFHKDGTA